MQNEADGRRPTVLFTQCGQRYADIPDLDQWCKCRDATRYRGPWPVVAHPPCARWSVLAHVHGRLGEDGGLFESALNAVRAWGGVLEHPANSMAFHTFALGRPRVGHWQGTTCGGWVTQVWQSAYGHPLAKPTWLYLYGNPYPPPLVWREAPGGAVDQSWTKQRERTPAAFGELLLELAASCTGSASW